MVKSASGLEPPINRELCDLDQKFRERLQSTLTQLAAEHLPFKFHEGYRTVARQSWLYAKGRSANGRIVTQKDGVRHLSNHQGTGVPGTGRAADCYPTTNGKVVLEPPKAVWRRYAEVAEAHGLVAGYRWQSPHDPPHVELPED